MIESSHWNKPANVDLETIIRMTRTQIILGERRSSKRSRHTKQTSSSTQRTSTTSRSSKQPSRSRSTDTQKDQEAATTIESSRQHEEVGVTESMIIEKHVEARNVSSR